MIYNQLKIFDKKEKQKIINMLDEQFGIDDFSGLIVKRGKERLFLFQGNFSPKEIKELERTIPIERVGVYFGKIVLGKDNSEKIRLSIDGVQIFREQIKKNIFELNDEQAREWMLGRELLIKTGKKDFLIIKYKDNFLGCGKASEEKITNFIPKNRRLKEKSIN